MLIYYIMYISLVVFAYIQKRRKPNIESSGADKSVFCMYAFLFIGTLWAIRHPAMSIDTIDPVTGGGYYFNYSYIGKLSWSRVFRVEVENYERGYIIFNKLLYSLFKNPQVLLATVAYITVGSAMYMIQKYSKMPLLSVVIYTGLPMFIFSISGLRQAMAIAITMWAFHMIVEKKPFRFIFLVLLASSFHSTAIVFFVTYPLYYMQQKPWLRWVLLLGIFVVYVFRSPLFAILSKIFKEDAQEGLLIEGTGLLFVVFCAISVFLTIFSDPEDEISNGTGNLFLLACYAQAFSGIYDLAMRIGYYFMIYAAVAIPSTLTVQKKGLDFDRNSKKIISVVVFIAFMLFALRCLDKDGVSSWSWYYTNPYRTFWE